MKCKTEMTKGLCGMPLVLRKATYAMIDNVMVTNVWTWHCKRHGEVPTIVSRIVTTKLEEFMRGKSLFPKVKR